MARRSRRTEPLETHAGFVHDYAEIESLLTQGEMRGRRWVFDRAMTSPGNVLRDVDVLDLHVAMFGEFLPWAGKTRSDDRGPGGKVPVPWPEVRVALRSLTDDLATWIQTAKDTDLATLATIVADTHHRFQWIHPFADTNGRTGRVVDHFLLWSTFDLRGSTWTTSPAIEYFPSEREEDEYYEGLNEADLGRPDRLREYYVERFVALFSS